MTVVSDIVHKGQHKKGLHYLIFIVVLIKCYSNIELNVTLSFVVLKGSSI